MERHQGWIVSVNSLPSAPSGNANVRKPLELSFVAAVSGTDKLFTEHVIGALLDR